MSEARIDRISNENSTAGPIISGITTFSGQNYFVPPKGTTAERPSYCSPGSIRFNTDSAKLEYFDSLQWLEMEAFNNELGISTAAAGLSAVGTGHRGVFGAQTVAGGTYSTIIDHITISTLGNGTKFGDLTVARGNGSGSCSSNTRGLFLAGIVSPNSTNIIDFITISSTGNAIDFGDTINKSEGRRALSSQTRGISFGGFDRGNSFAYYNTLDYVTIASTGNAVSFGSLSSATQNSYFGGACASSTRGIIGGGGFDNSNVIEYLTIATTGNTVDFGDLTSSRAYGAGAFSNSTRGVFAGGVQTPTPTVYNVIDYVTIATTGNAQDFGDLSSTISGSGYIVGACSPTRGVMLGNTSPATTILEYITIATTGNSTSFGSDSTFIASDGGFLSNGHGGL